MLKFLHFPNAEIGQEVRILFKTTIWYVFGEDMMTYFAKDVSMGI